MFRQVVFLAIVALALGAIPKSRRSKHNRPDGRIVGGHDADIADYPYQISLQYDGEHMCGGSIISENYVVTAAHCTDGTSAEELSIRANTSIVGEGGVVVNVKTINQNPQFDNYYVDYDISVLELSEPLTIGPGIQAVGLPQAGDQIADGTQVSVSGWGVLDENDYDLSTQLQVVEVNIINHKECQRAYSVDDVTDRMICAGVEAGGKDSCQGDSGGPLVANGVLWGIVSWGNGCAERGYPGVYGSVAALRDYITQVAGI